VQVFLLQPLLLQVLLRLLLPLDLLLLFDQQRLLQCHPE
jgi:hypothetical protein